MIDLLAEEVWIKKYEKKSTFLGQKGHGTLVLFAPLYDVFKLFFCFAQNLRSSYPFTF